jgi:simple sugar transport system permease protein
MRLIALLLGGVLAGLGGAELSLGGLQIFSVGMTAGRGFMAFAAVIFGAGHPVGATFAALFFSLVEYMGIKAQLVFGERAPRDFVLMLPYLATVLGIWISARLRGGVPLSAIEMRDG